MELSNELKVERIRLSLTAKKRCRGNGDQPPAALQHRAVGNRPRGGEIHRFSKEQRVDLNALFDRIIVNK